MNNEEALLAAFEADPGDTTTHAALADYYEESGKSCMALAHRLIARGEIRILYDPRLGVDPAYRWDVWVCPGRVMYGQTAQWQIGLIEKTRFDSEDLAYADLLRPLRNYRRVAASQSPGIALRMVMALLEEGKIKQEVD